MNRLSKIWKNFRTFLSDEDGTAGLEFVASSPLLLGVLVFTAEYGQAMRARLVLDRAVQDAARYLALAPADKGAVDASGNPTIAFYNDILNTAENLIEQRVNGGVAFTVTTETVDSVNFREPYYVIRVQASSAIDMPLLSLINLFSPPPDKPDAVGVRGQVYLDSPAPLQLMLTSSRQVRWTNPSPPGEASCLLADRYQGLCP